MEKSVNDLTSKIQNNKKVMTTTNVNDSVGNFVLKLCGVEAENIFNKTITSE